MKVTTRSLAPAPRALFKVAGATLCASGILAAASSASADDRAAIRIAADIPVFGIQHQFNGGPGSSTLGFFGVSAAPFQLGVGYQVNQHLYFGGRFGFQAQFPENSDAVFNGRFTFRFEYVFGGDKIRPFVGADAGFTATGFGGFGGAQTYGAFVGSASGGVHIFLTDDISLSPNLELGLQRFLDIDVNWLNVTGGATFTGWLWR